MQALQTQQVELVRATWALVAPEADAVAANFYQRLFALDRSLATLFKGDMAAQGRKLIDMIGAAIGLLDRPATLAPVLRSLGMRHAGYGVRRAHYDVVGKALLETLENGLGTAFTSNVQSAWFSVYAALSEQMLSGTSEAAVVRPLSRVTAVPATLAVAVLAIACAAAPLTQAQQVGRHPTLGAAAAVEDIDPNTFFVGHAASSFTRAGHVEIEHPAVMGARRAATLEPTAILVRCSTC